MRAEGSLWELTKGLGDLEYLFGVSSQEDLRGFL